MRLTSFAMMGIGRNGQAGRHAVAHIALAFSDATELQLFPIIVARQPLA
jgi:hypothetical protein